MKENPSGDCPEITLAGRIPSEIKHYLAKIPEELRRKLDVAKKASSEEVSPREMPHS